MQTPPSPIFRESHPSPPGIRWCHPLSLAVGFTISLLAACAHTHPVPLPGGETGASWREEAPASAITLLEPAADEVVVVINRNAAFGNHAGIFAGPRLSDPAGSYAYVRRAEPGWQPQLADYVRFQTSDGMHIRIYRFTLDGPDFSSVLARLPLADQAKPLFCATAVQNSIAGIGPFALIAETGWTTPASLAELLDRLIREPDAAGACHLPDSSPC